MKSDLIEIKDGFLTKEDFISVYNALSDVLHAKNPFALQTDCGRFKDCIAETTGKTIALLNTHQIRLYKSPNFLLVHMKEERDVMVHAYIFAPEKQ